MPAEIRYVDVDRAAFDEVYGMLDLTKKIGLSIDVNPPPPLIESVKQGELSALDGVELEAGIETFISQIFGAHSPQLGDDEDSVEGHFIWVNPKAGPDMASVSLVHEMVHAMQFESIGFQKYVKLDHEFMNTVGYAKNPFEIEADFTARFIVGQLGIKPIVEVFA
jgi:hypothetical protein